jgi:hypothetical protein
MGLLHLLILGGYTTSGGGSTPLDPAEGYVSHQYGDEFYDYLAADSNSDDLNYKAFPVLAKTDDGYVYKYIKAANRHWGTGHGQVQRSVDGINWSTITPSPYGNITVGGSTIVTGVPTIGASGNRVIISYNVPLTEGAGYQTGSYQWTDYAYSDDGGSTWTYADRVMSEYGDVGSLDKGIAAYGRMVKLPSGKLLQPVYVWNYIDDQYKVIFHESSDNGVTWVDGSTIISSTSEINETWVELVEEGAGDATTKLVAITRGEIIGGVSQHYQRYSDDGGTTWSAAGTITGTENVDNTFPIAMYKIEDTLYMISGIRYSDFSGPIGYYLAIRSKPATSYNNAAAWGEERIVTRPINEYKGENPQDWGYPELIQLDNGVVIACYYDESTYTRLSDTYKRHRIITINALFNYRYEAFNTAAQSAGALTFPTRWLDSDLMDLADLEAGDYLVEVSADESVSLTVNGTTATKHVIDEFTISAGGSIAATTAGTATNARIKVKKLGTATGVNFSASFSSLQTVSGKTAITFPTLNTDTDSFRHDSFDTFPYEGDYDVSLTINATGSGSVWIEVIDWGMAGAADGRRMIKEYTVASGANSLRALFLDVHTNYELKVYSNVNVNSGTVTIEKV